MLSRSILAVMLGTTAVSAASHALASEFDQAVMNTPGLLGYYPFTPKSQANSTVNGYTGSLQNGATIGGPGSGPPVQDPNSSALLLNNGASGNAYATASGSNPLLGGINQSGSIIAWINLASLPSTYNRIYSIAGESQSGNDFDLQVEGDRIRFYTDGGSATVSRALTSADVGQWIFVAATFEAGAARDIYLNGIMDAAGVPGGHLLNNSPFYQGESNVFTGRYFDGRLADVGVFDRSLTAAEVQGLYQASFQGTPSPVPLPASAPLFGAAVLALGAVRYGVRRSKAAA